MQSMDREFSSSSFLWLCRDTWRCRVAMSVTYFMLYDEDTRYFETYCFRSHEMF